MDDTADKEVSMYEMEIMMGYPALQKRQDMLYGKVEKGASKTEREKEAYLGESGDSKEACGAEVEFEVSGRAVQIASQIRTYYVMEQQMALKEKENTKKEVEQSEKETTEKKEKKKREETPFQRQLREKLEEAKSLDTMFRRMRELNEQAKKKNSKKKKVNYSYHRISAAISGAKTSTQASLALSSASSNVSALKRKAASGQYEKKEIETAIAHAEKMVRIARKKVQNIKWEIQQKKRNRSKEEQKKQKNSKIHQIPKRAKAEKELFRLKEQLKAQERSKKHKNRREEDVNLMSADMQYLQKKALLLKQDMSSFSASGEMLTVSNGHAEGMADLAVRAENVQTAAAVGGTVNQSGGENVCAGSD